MTKDQEFKLLKIQTCVLKVNLNCDGCKQKVKKLLQRIEGVYTVAVDGENQRVTVSGIVDSATLIKRLVRSGKYAEIWTAQKQKPPQGSSIKDDMKNNHDSSNNKGGGGAGGQKQNQPRLLKNLDATKNQRAFLREYEDEDDAYPDDDCGEYEDDLQFLREKAAKQLALLRQQGIDPTKKGAANIGSDNSANTVNVGKKGNPNQNIDPKAPTALKMNAGYYGNDLNAMMMGLPGVRGNANPSLTGNLQAQPHGGTVPSSAAAAQLGSGGWYHNLYGNGVSPAQTMMGPSHAQLMQGRYPHAPPLPQPDPPTQMMYHRSPYAPSATTGYYYGGYGPAPYGYYGGYENYHGGSGATAHMLNEYSTSICSIM